MKTRERKPTNNSLFLSQDTTEAVVREFKVTGHIDADKMPVSRARYFSSPPKKNYRQFTSRALAATFLKRLDLD